MAIIVDQQTPLLKILRTGLLSHYDTAGLTLDCASAGPDRHRRWIATCAGWLPALDRYPRWMATGIATGSGSLPALDRYGR